MLRTKCGLEGLIEGRGLSWGSILANGAYPLLRSGLLSGRGRIPVALGVETKRRLSVRWMEEDCATNRRGLELEELASDRDR